MYEAAGDKGVDDGEGVGDEAVEDGLLVVLRYGVGIWKNREGTYLEIKLYASPGGGASTVMMQITQCQPRPGKGALKGRLLAQNLENGRMPSLPSSCTRRPCEKMTLSTFPRAESATKTDSARSAVAPNTLRNSEAATRRLAASISSFGTAAKYEMLTRM